MVLSRIKHWLGLETVDPHEREVLEREYRRLEEKIGTIEGKLGTVHCSSCVKKEDPKAKRLLARRRKHRKRQKEIERALGGAPEIETARSRRKSKRASA